MAATMAAISGVATFAPVSGLRSSTAALKAPAASSAMLSRRNFSVVRCQGPIDSVKEAVKDTKVNITEKDIQKGMSENPASAWESDSGASKSPLGVGRTEMDRRPETGDRSFGSLMAFDGAGPETINGRLAMLGVPIALIGEALTGKTIFEQLVGGNNTGLFLFGLVTNIVLWASLTTMFQGESPDSRRNGIFTAQAERWNGRTAMLGFVGLILFEVIHRHPFIGA